MLVWEGDQNICHRSPFKRERREWNVIGRQAGSAVDDRVMLTASWLTAAGREYC